MEKQDRAGDAAAVRLDDPWYDALADGWGEMDGPAMAPCPTGRPRLRSKARSAADIYLEVQRSAAFQEVRGRYRRFVVPASLAFFVWYFAYVVAATTAPGLMAQARAGRGERGDGGRTRPVPHDVPADLGVRAPRPAAQGPRRPRTALGHPGDDERGRAVSGGPPDAGAAAVQRVRRGHARDHHLGQPQQARLRGGVLRGRAALLADGERFRHRGRLHVRRVLPRHLGADRPLRLRRHALLGRASSWPGWSSCSSSPNSCATAAGSRSPTWSPPG